MSLLKYETQAPPCLAGRLAIAMPASHQSYNVLNTHLAVAVACAASSNKPKHLAS